MLRWFLTATGLAAFNQCLADQDLSRLLLIFVLPVWSNFNNNKYQLYANELLLCSSISEFYNFYYWWWWFWLFIISNLSRLWTNFIFFLFSFRMRVSGSRHIYNFVSSESGNTLLLLNWKNSFNYFMVTEKGFVLSLLYQKWKIQFYEVGWIFSFSHSNIIKTTKFLKRQ